MAERLEKSTSILVTCYDGYADLWPGFRERIKKYMEFDASVYLASVNGNASDGDTAFMDLKTGNGEYCGRLISALNQIQHKRIFMLLEDYYITEPWTKELWDKMTSLHWDDPNTGKVQYGIPSDMYSFSVGTCCFKRGSRYATSLEPGIWDREFLLGCLLPNETAWDFEVEGNRRMWKGFNRKIYFHEWRGYKNIRRKT